jgi:hypothetical protein
MLLDKAMCPLREAAELIGCSTASLLENAISGGVELYTKVPTGLQVISVHTSHRARFGTFSTLSPGPKQAQYPAFSIPGLQFLVLGKSCLTGIYNNGTDTEVSFDGGLMFSREGSCHLFRASSYTLVYDAFTVEELDLPLRSYALYPNELDLRSQDARSLRFDKSLEVTWEDVFVRRIDVANLVPKRPSREKEVIKRVQELNGAYVSSNLNRLRLLLLSELEAFAVDGGELPTLEILTSKLKQQAGFSSNQAEAGAHILRLSLSTISQWDDDGIDDEPAIIHLFNFAASLWGSSSGESAPRALVPEVANMLQKKIDMSESSAKACVTLIRPRRQSGRPPKGKTP